MVGSDRRGILVICLAGMPDLKGPHSMYDFAKGISISTMSLHLYIIYGPSGSYT